MRYLLTLSIVLTILGLIGIVGHAIIITRQNELISRLAVTFLGVFLALTLNSLRDYANEEQKFYMSLQAFKSELESNLSVVKNVRENISSKQTLITSLKTNVNSFLLSNVTTYKFGKKGLQELLPGLLRRTEDFNAVSKIYLTKISSNTPMSENDVKRLSLHADQVRFLYEIAFRLINEDYLNNANVKLEKESIYDALDQTMEQEKLAGHKNYNFEK